MGETRRSGGNTTERIKIWDKYFEVYLPELVLGKRIKEMAALINKDYETKRPLFLAVLNGSFMFAADLMKEISIRCEISFVKVASYKGTTSTGNTHELIGLSEDIYGRNIIVLEDIVDTGLTVSRLYELLDKHSPQSVRVASLLFKPDALKFTLKPDYTGFDIPNDFVVGYGLDYNGLGRNYRDIYRLSV